MHYLIANVFTLWTSFQWKQVFFSTVRMMGCNLASTLGKVVRFWFRPHHRREVISPLGCGDPCVPGPGGPAQQGLQSLAGHVVGGCHNLREPQRDLPLQRGRGHQRPNSERRLYVPLPPLEEGLPGGWVPQGNTGWSNCLHGPVFT